MNIQHAFCLIFFQFFFCNNCEIQANWKYGHNMHPRFWCCVGSEQFGFTQCAHSKLISIRHACRMQVLQLPSWTKMICMRAMQKLSNLFCLIFPRHSSCFAMIIRCYCMRIDQLMINYTGSVTHTHCCPIHAGNKQMLYLFIFTICLWIFIVLLWNTNNVIFAVRIWWLKAHNMYGACSVCIIVSNFHFPYMHTYIFIIKISE